MYMCTFLEDTPNLPTNIVPTNIARLKLSGRSPMGLGIPPFKLNVMLESSPLKPTMLVGGLGIMIIILATLLIKLIVPIIQLMMIYMIKSS